MDSQRNETTVTKFMDTAANETLNVKFLETDGDVTVSKENVNMTVIQFLEDTLYDAFERMTFP